MQSRSSVRWPSLTRSTPGWLTSRRRFTNSPSQFCTGDQSSDNWMSTSPVLDVAARFHAATHPPPARSTILGFKSASPRMESASSASTAKTCSTRSGFAAAFNQFYLHSRACEGRPRVTWSSESRGRLGDWDMDGFYGFSVSHSVHVLPRIVSSRRSQGCVSAGRKKERQTRFYIMQSTSGSLTPWRPPPAIACSRGHVSIVPAMFAGQ